MYTEGEATVRHPCKRTRRVFHIYYHAGTPYLKVESEGGDHPRSVIVDGSHWTIDRSTGLPELPPGRYSRVRGGMDRMKRLGYIVCEHRP